MNEIPASPLGASSSALSGGRRLRVLSIAHSAVNRTSGRTRYEALAALHPEIELTLVAPDRWQEYGKPMRLEPHSGPLDFKIERIRLPYVPKAGWYLHHYPSLGRIISASAPDVIHLWEEPWSLVALQAMWLRARLAPRAAVLLETDQNILRRLPAPFEQIRRFTLRRTDLLIGRQPEALDVSRRSGFDGPTAIVEYAVAPGVFAPGDRDAARASIGITASPHALVLGYVGRIVREKGLHDVLDAMAASPAEVILLILGTGPDQAALVAHAKARGVAERVRILEPRPPSGVAEVMRSLDALVLMSRATRTWKEQFGRVIMEAHACAVPVIGSDSGSIPGVVAAGGWIVPEGDSKALAELIGRLAGERAELSRAGQAGLVQARSRFAIETVANSLADAYFRAAEARRARH